MSTLRAAAQQALKALGSSLYPQPRQMAAIAALKAALAEPVQEPVAFSVGRTLHWHEGKGVSDAQLFAAPPQRPAKPQGCDHCNHPLYAATKCRVCGRAT